MKAKGRNVAVLEAVPFSGNIIGPIIWVDMVTVQIVKTEISGIPISGHENVLKDAVMLIFQPSFIVSQEYQLEKQRVRFPTLTKLRVEYPGLMTGSLETKLRIDSSYKNYMFFVVESSHEVLK